MTSPAEEQSDERGRLRRDVAWNLVPVVVLAGVGLGLNFVIAAWWDEAALGAFNLVTTALFAFAVIGACGLQFAVLRAVAEDPDDRARVASVVVGALVPNVVIAAIVTAAFVALHGPIGDWLGSRSVAQGMLWASPGLFCFSLNKTLMGIVNGLRRMRAFAVYTTLRYSLIAVGLVLARTLRLDAEQLPAIWSFVEGALLLVLAIELVTQVALHRARGWVAHAREQLSFGLRGVVATLAAEVNSKLDVWMLGVVTTEAQVGIYSMAAALNEGAQQLAVVLQNNLNPVLANSLARGDDAEVELVVRRTRRWFVPAFVAICALGAAAFPLIVPWLIGKPQFVVGAVPFAIMMAGLALASAYLPFTQLLLMAARPGWHTVLVLGVVGVNFALNALLVGPLGLPGAAIGIAGSVVASAILLRVLVRWRVGLKI